MKNNKYHKHDKIAFRVLCIIFAALIVLPILLMLSGCGNMSVIDSTWSFERAIIFLPDGEKIEGKVTNWNDYDGSDMIQVRIDDKVYLTHSSNVVMISE